jgi:hypothetical protein
LFDGVYIPKTPQDARHYVKTSVKNTIKSNLKVA